MYDAKLSVRIACSALTAAGLLTLAVPAYLEGSAIEIYKDANPWAGENRDELALDVLGFVAGVDYGVSPTSELLNPMPEDVKVIIIPSNSFVLTFSEENVNAATAQANLQTFLDNGGSLIVHMAADSLAGLSYTAPGIGQTIDVPDTNQLELTAPTTNGIVLGPDSMPGTADDLTNSGIGVCT